MKDHYLATLKKIKFYLNSSSSELTSKEYNAFDWACILNILYDVDQLEVLSDIISVEMTYSSKALELSELEDRITKLREQS